MSVLLQKWYVLARQHDGATMRGHGYVDVVAASEEAAVAKALAQPWPEGTELGAALVPDVFRVKRWWPAARVPEAGRDE